MALFEITYSIPESDLEPRYKHVSHFKSIEICDRCRCDFIKSIGIPNETLIAQATLIVVTDIHAIYKREIEGGPIKVTLDDVKIENKTLIMRQTIFNSKLKEAVNLTVEMVFMSAETRRSIFPPENFLEAVNRWKLNRG